MQEPSREVDVLANRVIGAAIEVHRAQGPGYLESVYEQALCIELELQSIPFKSQTSFCLHYKEREIGDGRLDLLVEDELIVELKAVDSFAPIHSAQVISYLKATGKKLGLLFNFNLPILKNGIKRIVLSQQ